MATRTLGKSKLTPEVRRRLVELAAEARGLVYGQAGCPEWGTKFVEIEADARELGQEFMRLMMEQTNSRQAADVPDEALRTDSGEVAVGLISADRALETEAGGVSWKEPKAYLPKSRKDFFPSVPSLGADGGRGVVAGGDA